MATPDRDTVYTTNGADRTIYTRESNSTGWFVGIIVALALLAIAYLVFSANTQPNTIASTAPAVTAPATTPTTPAITTPAVPQAAPAAATR